MYLDEFLWKAFSVLNLFLGLGMSIACPMVAMSYNLEGLPLFEIIMRMPIWLICLLVLFVINTAFFFVYSIYLTLPTISNDGYGIRVDFADPSELFNEKGHILVSGFTGAFILGILISLLLVL